MAVRAIQVMEKPIHKPFVCIVCGCGENDRDYFVDVGIDSELIMPNEETGLKHFTEGVVYFCNSCLTNIFVEATPKIFEFIRNTHTSMILEQGLNQTAHNIQAEEIKNLRAEINELKEYHATLPVLEDNDLDETLTGEEIAEEILGEPNGTGTANFDVNADDRSAETNDREPESSNGNDDEPAVISIATLGLAT